MRRFLAFTTALALLAVGASVTAQSASAATWVVTAGSFTVDDGFGATLSIDVQNLKITDGASASGYVRVGWGRYNCSTQVFVGTRATFFPSSLDPCSGTITFTLDPATGNVSASAALTMASRLFTGSATGTGVAVKQVPVVVPLQGCTATMDTSAREMKVTWVNDPNAGGYALTVNGLPGFVLQLAPVSSAGLPFSRLLPGASYSATLTARNAAGDIIANCTTNDVLMPWPSPGAPSIVSSPIAVSGGQVTVNYDVADPATVKGIEYQIDGGAWLRPGGTAPTTGVGGSFTVGGLSVGQHAIVLRSVGFDPQPMTTQSSSTPFVIPAPVKPPDASPGPGQNTATAAIGSPARTPVPPPPAQPTSSVSGSSNGAGMGTRGALAAGTGDASVDAPCLAQDGSLYPTMYSTVGSQLTMAPNTHGMGKAISFTVIAGALPTGMQLDRQFGIVYGVPTQAGAWTTTVRAAFANGSTKDGQFSTRVEDDPQTLQYAAQNIGSVGERISIAPSTNALTVGTTYRLVCGILPNGTRLDTATGRILGKPTSVVSRPIPLRIAETSSTGTAAASFIFVVDTTGTYHLSYPAHPRVRPGKRVTIRPTVSGVGDILEYRTWLGKLPAGLRLNKATGVISGRVKKSGPTHEITLVAQTKAGALIASAPMRLSLTR